MIIENISKEFSIFCFSKIARPRRFLGSKKFTRPLPSLARDASVNQRPIFQAEYRQPARDAH